MKKTQTRPIQQERSTVNNTVLEQTGQQKLMQDKEPNLGHNFL